MAVMKQKSQVSRMQPLFLLLAIFLCGNASAQKNSAIYYDKNCGIRFEVPEGWTAQPDTSVDKHDICKLHVRPNNLGELTKQNGNVDLYTIEISTTERDFDSAAILGQFERRKTEWVVLGRTGIESPAIALSSDKWLGLKGTATVGCYEVNGGAYVGLCDVPRAVLNNRKQKSAILYGSSQSSEQFECILNSFEFLL